jgi:hypothetical protein
MVTVSVMAGVLGLAAFPLFLPPVLALIAGAGLIATVRWLVGHRREVSNAFSALVAWSVARVSRFRLGSLMIVIAASSLLLSVVQFIDWGNEPKRQLLLRQADKYAADEIEVRRKALESEGMAGWAKDFREANAYRSQADELSAEADNLHLLSERYRRAAEQVGTIATVLSPQTRSLLQESLPPE